MKSEEKLSSERLLLTGLFPTMDVRETPAFNSFRWETEALIHEIT